MGKKAKKKEAHAAYQPTNKAHKTATSFDGGACLIRHEALYVEKNSCSYRWQGVHKAEAQPGRAAYDAHSNSQCHIGQKNTGAVRASTAQALMNSPGSGVQSLKTFTSKKGQLCQVVESLNFSAASIPYGNQVHHVLNNSSLHKGIDDLAAISARIRKIIVDGLLDEEYNLNHADNSMILPTKDKDCIETGLPKHYGSHPDYNIPILDAVKAALAPYRKIAEQLRDKTKPHDPPDPAALKESLEAISEAMYDNIMSLAAKNRASGNRTATSVNTLPPSAYQGL